MTFNRRVTWGYFKISAALVLLAAAAVVTWSFVSEWRNDREFSIQEIEQKGDRAIQILSVGDPFAFAIKRAEQFLIEQGMQPFTMHILSYSNTLKDIIYNSAMPLSQYHLISFDTVWLSQLVEAGVLSPITSQDWEDAGLSETYFSQLTMSSNTIEGMVYGMPVQPHPELLWYRKDLLEEKGWHPPETLEQLLELARAFNDPENNFYGLAWNANRGQALGQTVAHLLAAFGAPIMTKEGLIRLDRNRALQMADFLMALLEVSPPDILTMAWDQRVERFARGHVAFTYGWTGRSPVAEEDPLSVVRGKIGYATPPSHQDCPTTVPFGQWSLGVPANLNPSERARSLRWLGQLLRVERSAQWGHYSYTCLLYTDPQREVIRQNSKKTGSNLCQKLIELEKAEALHFEVRPGIPQWPELADILGTVFHDMLKGDLTPAQAVDVALDKVHRLFAGEENS